VVLVTVTIVRRLSDFSPRSALLRDEEFLASTNGHACVEALGGRRAQRLARGTRNRIAPYKIPRYWKFVDEFPTTGTRMVQSCRRLPGAAIFLRTADDD
jgi:hypothetical protein